MSQGNDFANNTGSTDPEGSEPEEVWFVAVTGDDVKQMTLDQVADAFQAGTITSQTAVWTEGMEAWAPLGDVADLGDEPDEAPTELAPAGPEAFAQAAFAQAPAPQAAPSVAPAPLTSVAAPVITDSIAPSAQVSQPPFVQSTVPVALSVEDDDEPFAPKKERRIGRWLLAAAGVLAVGVTALNFDAISGGSNKTSAKISVKAVKTLAARPFEPQATTKKVEVVAEKAEVAAKKAAEGDLPIGTATAGSSDEEETSGAGKAKKSLRNKFSGTLNKKKKKKRTKASKKRKYKKRAKAKSTRKRKRRRRRSSKKKTVKRTESAFDPLNGSLP